MDEESLEGLVRRAQAGDRDALDALVRRCGSRVRAVLHGRLGTDLRARVDTEDIFQSTMSASLEDLQGLRYEGEEAFLRWLAQVAERRLLDAARRHRAGCRDVGRERPLDVAAGVPGAMTSPTEGVAREQARSDLRRALASLPDRERRVIELRSYAGLTFEVIAEQMGLSDRHAARNLYRRALGKMGDLLDAGGEGA